VKSVHNYPIDNITMTASYPNDVMGKRINRKLKKMTILKHYKNLN